MNILLIALTVTILVVSLFRLGYRIGHINGYDKGSRDILRLYMNSRKRPPQRINPIDFEDHGWFFDEN